MAKQTKSRPAVVREDDAVDYEYKYYWYEMKKQNFPLIFDFHSVSLLQHFDT